MNLSKDMGILISISLLIGSCTLSPEAQPEPTIIPDAGRPFTSPVTPSAVPVVQLPETDQILFTIPNPEPFSGREGEPRPNWLGWGAETFTVAPDGSFWIADTAVFPNRLLHYSPQGKLLLEASLDDLVVYAFDLAVTQDRLWVLDVSAQTPRIVQLDTDGRFKSNWNIPNEVITQADQFISNGAFDLSLGEEGELLLFTINGYYEIADASGQVAVRPLDSYGHTYQTGIYDEAANQLPIFVDGRLLDISPDFFVEVPFLGFHPTGSFAIAGWVEDAEHQIDHQVRYYSPSGELLGTARQRPQTFYKDWNHHLAFGPDGSIYQLLSNPDHSVQILRLGFSEELLPVMIEPVLTSTPLTALLPSESATTDEEQARNILLAFFADLSAGNYAEAAFRFGGEDSEYAREPLSGETTEEYWEYICGFLWCLPIAEITDTEQISQNEFVFHIVFMHPDGTRFEIGACCGGDPAASPPVWQFAYPVRKIDGAWKVMRGPLFTP